MWTIFIEIKSQLMLLRGSSSSRIGFLNVFLFSFIEIKYSPRVIMHELWINRSHSWWIRQHLHLKFLRLKSRIIPKPLNFLLNEIQSDVFTTAHANQSAMQEIPIVEGFNFCRRSKFAGDDHFNSGMLASKTDQMLWKIFPIEKYYT